MLKTTNLMNNDAIIAIAGAKVMGIRRRYNGLTENVAGSDKFFDIYQMA